MVLLVLSEKKKKKVGVYENQKGMKEGWQRPREMRGVLVKTTKTKKRDFFVHEDFFLFFCFLYFYLFFKQLKIGYLENFSFA